MRQGGGKTGKGCGIGWWMVELRQGGVGRLEVVDLACPYLLHVSLPCPFSQLGHASAKVVVKVRGDPLRNIRDIKSPSEAFQPFPSPDIAYLLCYALDTVAPVIVPLDDTSLGDDSIEPYA